MDMSSPHGEPGSRLSAQCCGILDLIPVSAYICDTSGQITYFNALAEAVWGRAPKLRDEEDRYCGSHQLFSLAGAAIPHCECWMARALIEDKAFMRCDIVIARRNGTCTIGQANVHPLRDGHGRIVAALNLIANMTELKAGVAGSAKPPQPTLAYAATLAMIDVTVSMFTAMPWENTTLQ
jgi:PAS domain-containing protein